MTREEWVRSGGADRPAATCATRKAAADWARTFSTWDSQTYVVVAGDGYFEAIPRTSYEPWRGRVIGHFAAGKRVNL